MVESISSTLDQMKDRISGLEDKRDVLEQSDIEKIVQAEQARPLEQKTKPVSHRHKRRRGTS
jgi:hypothetical protein